MKDDTEATRRAMIPDMPVELRAAYHAGEQIWTTADLRADFDVLGFQAPFVAVKRKIDGVRGSLKFTHSPRYYFDWRADL